jgi:aldose sugar dehydrogenase
MTRPTPLLLLLCAALLSACAGKTSDAAPGGTDSAAAVSAACTPIDSRTAEAPSQKPAFTGQTRACAINSNVALDVTVLATGLQKPWSVEPLPNGEFLVTEKPGRLRLVNAAGVVSEPITGLPAVDAKGQGGLLDVALSPTFAADNTIYWSFSEPRKGGNATSVARGVLSADRRSLTAVRVIYQAMPVYDGASHFGSRLAFGPDSMLYLTLGDRSDTPMRPQAQQLNSDMGKVLRIRPDGSIPSDNPFVSTAGARPAIWSLGHRNMQAGAFDTAGNFWEAEHGTRGGDELNMIQKGKNYGWPLQAYGKEYSGDMPIKSPAGESATARDGMEQPVYYWDPVIAPSGMQWYSGDAFPAWKGSLFIGGMKDKFLVRLEVKDGKVTGEEHLLGERGQRVRDVRQGPDGALYIVTDEDKGELWRVAPKK